MKNISDIREVLASQAFAMLVEEGYQVTEKDVRLSLTVEGYDRRYEGWSTEISPKDWEKILSISWDEPMRKILELLRSRGNSPLSDKEIEEIKPTQYWDFVNEEFKRNFMPYHFTATIKVSRRSRKYCQFRGKPRWRLFIRPILR